MLGSEFGKVTGSRRPYGSEIGYAYIAREFDVG